MRRPTHTALILALVLGSAACGASMDDDGDTNPPDTGDATAYYGRWASLNVDTGLINIMELGPVFALGIDFLTETGHGYFIWNVGADAPMELLDRGSYEIREGHMVFHSRDIGLFANQVYGLTADTFELESTQVAAGRRTYSRTEHCPDRLTFSTSNLGWAPGSSTGYASVAVDQQGTPHVAFGSGGSGGVFLSNPTEYGCARWNEAEVTVAGELAGETELAFGADGTLSLAYHDWPMAIGRLATRGPGETVWDLEDLGAVSYLNSMAVDASGAVYLGQYRSYLEHDGMAWMATEPPGALPDSSVTAIVGQDDARYLVAGDRFYHRDGDTWVGDPIDLVATGIERPPWCRDGAVDADGVAHLVCIDRGHVYYVTNRDGWSAVALGVGADVSVALDDAGVPQLAMLVRSTTGGSGVRSDIYWGRVLGDAWHLRYVSAISLVGTDVPIRTVAQNLPLGVGVELAVDADGFAHIAWGDQSIYYATNRVAFASTGDATNVLSRALTVEVDAGLVGRVVSTPPGIDCGPGETCSARFELDAAVLLEMPDGAQLPADCLGSIPCRPVLRSDRTLVFQP